jgi:hypothetical protein
MGQGGHVKREHIQRLNVDITLCCGWVGGMSGARQGRADNGCFVGDAIEDGMSSGNYSPINKMP